MKRYLDFSCPQCNFSDEFFTTESTVPCPNCGTEMIIVWNKAPGIGDPIRLGVTKPPADFDKYVLGRIKEKFPKSTIGYKRPLAREI